jgi:TPR repeat protein
MKSITIALAAAISVTGTTASSQSNTPSASGIQSPKPLNSDAEIARAQVPVLEKDALSGDPRAAFRLAMYYDLIVMDMRKYEYWTTIAAENGNIVGEYNLGYLLANRGGDLNRKRAIYWLKKAALAGDTGCENPSYAGCVSLLRRLEQGQARK